MAAAILKILEVVGSIALMFGAQHISDRVQRTKAQAKRLSQDQLLARLNGILAEAERTNSKMASEISASISALPDAARIISSSAAEAITNKRKELSKELADVESRMVDNNRLSERVSSFAYQPDSYKLSAAGKSDLASIETAVDKTINGNK